MTDWPGEPTTTREQMMVATYRALCEHGYVETSIQRIADEFDKSKSLLYYHYDDKEALLSDFLSFLLEALRTELAAVPGDDPRAALEEIVDGLLPAPMAAEEFRLRKAIVQLSAEAAHRDTYREQLALTEELLLDELATVIANGVEEGSFREVDPEATAAFLYTTIIGAIYRAVTQDDPDLVVGDRERVEAYLRESVYREE